MFIKDVKNKKIDRGRSKDRRLRADITRGDVIEFVKLYKKKENKSKLVVIEDEIKAFNIDFDIYNEAYKRYKEALIKKKERSINRPILNDKDKVKYALNVYYDFIKNKFGGDSYKISDKDKGICKNLLSLIKGDNNHILLARVLAFAVYFYDVFYFNWDVFPSLDTISYKWNEIYREYVALKVNEIFDNLII